MTITRTQNLCKLSIKHKEIFVNNL